MAPFLLPLYPNLKHRVSICIIPLPILVTLQAFESELRPTTSRLQRNTIYLASP